MIKVHLKIALRNLLKNKFFSALNILGLSIGVTFFTLLVLFITHEVSYDTIHSKKDRIYRVVEIIEKNGTGERSASVPFPTLHTLINFFPQYVETGVRVFNFQMPDFQVEINEEKHTSKTFYFADWTFFKVFDYPLKVGDPAKVLVEENSVVISDKIAKEYFQEEDPIGKEIILGQNLTLTVTGVLAPIDYNSHFQFDFLASSKSVSKPEYNWVWNPCWTYLLLNEGVNPEDLEEGFPAYLGKYFPDFLVPIASLYLQPLSEIHLYSNLDYELKYNGEANYLYIFIGIAVLILLVTMINFTNLSTARSSLRTKEIGIRKAIGAFESELVDQFMVEAFLITCISTLLALVFIEQLLPYVGQLSGYEFNVNTLNVWHIVGITCGAGLAAGLLASIYPAYFLSRFEPVQAFQRAMALGVQGRSFRKVLVVIQLSITLTLIIASLVIIGQMRYMQQTNLGFDKDALVVVPLSNKPAKYKYQDVKQNLLLSDEIAGVSRMEEILGFNTQTHKYDGFFEDHTQTAFLPTVGVGKDLMGLYGIELLAGAYFEEDSIICEKQLIVNMEMTRYLGLDRPEDILGMRVSMDDNPARVVGLVQDFNFQSLHKTIKPLILAYSPTKYLSHFDKFMVVKFKDANTGLGRQYLQTVWNNLISDQPLETIELEDLMASHYQRERRLMFITINFSIIACLIAGLGIFGLVSFSISRRRKEIAIRKALGAPLFHLVYMMSKEFIFILVLSVFFSSGVSYWVMNSWLQTFPFHITIPVYPFLIAMIVGSVLIVLCLAYHIVKAVMKSPVEELQFA